MSSNMHNGEGQIKGHAPMSDHLPECPTTTDPHGLDDGYACPCECQCEILRACEQRVLNTVEQAVLAKVHQNPTTPIQIAENSGLGMAWSVIDELLRGGKQ